MKKAAVFILIVVFISACSIVGVHFKLHNPKRAGTYPEKTEALNLLGDQESRFRTCYDVKQYDLQFIWDVLDDKADIGGATTMTAIALEDCDTIQIDLHENMKLNWVREANAAQSWAMIDTLPYYRRDGAVFVVLESPVVKGKEFGIIISYTGIPPTAKRPPWRGGFVRKNDDRDSLWWGVACQSEGASMWWACKDVVNDEPDSVHMLFAVPKGLMVVSNGQLFGHFSDSIREYWQWKVTYPINLYNITFYIGKYKLLHDTYTSKVTADTLALNHYVLEQHYDQAKEHFKQLKDHLAVYEQLFGPYPFYRDGFKLVESPYAGMEHQTAIAYGNKFKNNYLGFDYIILHETAHEWWGNSLTAYDLADGWLHEGFATYAECLYVEKKHGYQAYLDYLRTQRWTIINRRPVVGPYGQRYFNYKDGDIYMKGSWILHTLRQTINKDSVFFDIIRTFATRFAYSNVTSKDFVALVNEKTGVDYQWFFDQYLYNRFVPELEYCESGGKVYYRFNPEFTNASFRLPIALSDTMELKTDTLIPTTSVSITNTPAGSAFYWHTGVLVKFTENKKLKKEYVRRGTEF